MMQLHVGNVSNYYWRLTKSKVYFIIFNIGYKIE